MQLDPTRSALVIQDLQNDVIIEGGAFAESGAPAHAISQNVVANVAELAATARRAGIPVIHVWYVVEEGGRLTVVDARVRLLQVCVALADRLDLAALEDDPALVGVEYEEVVPRLAVGDGDLVAAP